MDSAQKNYRIKGASFTVLREAVPEWKNRARLSSPEEAVAGIRPLIADDAREHFWMLMLDAQNGLVAALMMED
jgi:DNA repair protein RadC